MAGESRKAFEDWYAADTMPQEADWFKLEPNEEYYELDCVEGAWQGWRACWEFLSKMKSK